jgi:hypothetical protein
MRCTSCLRVNKDESLSIAREEARKYAVEKQYPVAIVEEGGEYIFYNAFYAFENHLNVKEVVSYL